MAIAKKPTTTEEFARMPGHEEAELIDGKVIKTASPDPLHGKIAGEVNFHIKLWLRESKAEITGVGGGFVVHRDPCRTRTSDVWFMRAERVPEGEPESFWKTVSDLAVEIIILPSGETNISDSDTAVLVKEKLTDYFAGVPSWPSSCTPASSRWKPTPRTGGCRPSGLQIPRKPRTVARICLCGSGFICLKR